MAKYDDRDIYRAQYRQLVRLLEEAAFSLEEGSAQVRARRREMLCQTHTERFRSSLIALISIFLRPILTLGAHVMFESVDWTDFGGVVDSRPVRPACR